MSRYDAKMPHMKGNFYNKGSITPRGMYLISDMRKHRSRICHIHSRTHTYTHSIQLYFFAIIPSRTHFPTSTRHLCRVRAHLTCSYFSNSNTRGADSVVVSASDWHAGAPGLINRRSKPVIFCITTTRQLVVQCYASRTLACLVHQTYPNVAQAAIPLYNDIPMCVPKE